jgi:uncharacterized protein (TIGR00369 family)
MGVDVADATSTSNPHPNPPPMRGRELQRSPEEQTRFDAALTELFEQRITFNSVIGLKVVSLTPGDVRMCFEMQPQLVGHYAYGRLHGGVISTALDAMAGLALMVAIGQLHPAEAAPQVMQRFSRMGTIDLRVDYLRQGIGTRFEASAEVTRLGGRVASVLARLHNQDELLIATSAASYIVS